MTIPAINGLWCAPAINVHAPDCVDVGLCLHPVVHPGPCKGQKKARKGKRLPGGPRVRVKKVGAKPKKTAAPTAPKPAAPAALPAGILPATELFGGKGVNGEDATPAQMRTAAYAYNGTHGGLTAEVRRVRSFQDQAVINGRVTDANGATVGSFSRRIRRSGDGEIMADHVVLDIDDAVQGQGFSQAFNRQAFNYYRSAGVDRVELTANITIGAYAWARAGYDWADEGSTGRTRTRLQRVASSDGPQAAAAGALLQRFRTLEFGTPGYPTPMEVTELGRPAGATRDDMWAGKQIMLSDGNEWRGVMRLRERARVPVNAAQDVPDARAEMMRALAALHDEWVQNNLNDTPFDPEGPHRAPDYNVHFVDIEASPQAQDAFSDAASNIITGDAGPTAVTAGAQGLLAWLAEPARIEACRRYKLKGRFPPGRCRETPPQGAEIVSDNLPERKRTTVRKAVPKKRIAQNPPSSSPSGKTRLDVGTRLNYADLVRKLEDRSGGGDKAMADIARRQGFDALPRKGSASELDAEIGAGGTETWRGQVGFSGRSAAEVTEQFLNGQAEYSPGLFGSGWSATADRRALDDQGTAATRIVIPADADVIDMDELRRRQETQERTASAQQRKLFKVLDETNGATAREKALRALQDWTARQPDRDRVLRDPGRFGAALGFDAIRVKRGDQPDAYVILNRGKVLAEDARPAVRGATDGVWAAFLLHDAAVSACMPPQVSVPKPGPCPGTKRGAKSAVAKVVKKSAKAPAKPKTVRTGPGVGKDMSDLLNMQEIAELPHRDSIGNDQRLVAIAEKQGFDAPAVLGTAQELDDLVAAGGQEMWRGVKPRDGLTPAQIHDQSATGPAFFGQGIHGNGIYYATSHMLASSYADFIPDPEAVQRAVLSADARTITYANLLEQMAADKSTSSTEYQQRGQTLLDDLGKAKDLSGYRMAWQAYQGNPQRIAAGDLLRTDPGAWAMSRGYDAIVVPYDGTDGGLAELVVLNRGALTVQAGRNGS